MEERLIIKLTDKKIIDKLKKMRQSGINISREISRFIAEYSIKEKRHI